MTAYYLRISDWSSDVCSSDLIAHHQYGRSCVAGEEPAAGVRDLIDMAGVEPGALPHAFTLQLQELGIGVADAGYIGQLGEILGRRIAAALIVHALVNTLDGLCVQFHDFPLLQIGRANVCTPVTNAQLICR